MRRTPAVSAGATCFAIVFAAGFVLGTVRTLVLAPRFGELVAVILEVPIMLALSWWACGWVLNRCRVPPRTPPRMAMGTVAFMLLMLAELVLALGFGRSMTQYASGLATSHGLIGLSGQVAFGLMPLVRRSG